MKRTDRVHTEGAEIVFDVQGAGDPVLMIPGAGGDGAVYGKVADLLSDRHTMITYDRRCNARSGGNADQMLDMAQQARDAVAVVRAAGFERATVFGNSGGGNIALQLAADHPNVLSKLVLHETPTVTLLKGKESVLDFVHWVYRAFRVCGVPGAMVIFMTRSVGFDLFKMPRGRLGRTKGLKFFFAKEYLPITLCEPNLDAIKAAQIPAVMLVGERSRDAYYVKAARAVAAELGCPFETISGNHLAFLFEPEDFAEALRDVLAR